MPCIGILNQTLNHNENGIAVTYGKVKGLNTDAFEDGDTVYVSSTTAGDITNDKPATTKTDLIQIGIVTKKTTAGVIFVTGIVK